MQTVSISFYEANMKTILDKYISAVSQPGEHTLVSSCPLSSGAAADRQLELQTGMLSADQSQSKLKKRNTSIALIHP